MKRAAAKLALLCLLAGLLVAALIFPLAGDAGMVVTRLSDSVVEDSAQLLQGEVPTVSTMVDAAGTPIAWLYAQRRWPVPTNRIADTMKLAIVTVHGRRSRQRMGVATAGAGSYGGADSHIRHFVEGYGDAPFLAVGAVHNGLAGFRRSHAQARDVRRVAVAGQCTDRVTAAEDPGVSIAALLTDDLERTRAWVSDTLGPLAGDTQGDARLRETLRVFLRAGCSYKAAAEQLTLHHNSVRYRIERAVERRGRPILDDRLDVELALQFCHRFGAGVLQSAPER